MLRSGRWRYLRTARVMAQLPMYARLVWGVFRDHRTPLHLKALLAAALVYVVTPVDLIPDFIPIIGTADDLTVLLLVLDLFLSTAPKAVRDEHLSRAQTGESVLDEDLARLRSVLGERFDHIRDRLPELLERYGNLRDADDVKAQIAEWRTARARRSGQTKTHAPVEVE